MDCCSRRFYCRKQSGRNCRENRIQRLNDLTKFYELWRTRVALGITFDPDSDGVLYSRRASRTQTLAGVCFSAVAAATCRNGKSSAAGSEIFATGARPFVRSTQSGPAAPGLYVCGCKTEKA